MSECVSDLGFRSCDDQTLMLSSGVFNSDWLSLCFLNCCCFDVWCSEVSSSLVIVLLSVCVTIPTFPQCIFFSRCFYSVCQSLPEWPWFCSSPLVPQDAGSQQIGFLLGSCGVTLALTTDACQKGLPKAQTGEVATFKGTDCFIFMLSVCKVLSVWTYFNSLCLQAGRGYCGLWQMENMLWSLRRTGILHYGKPVMTLPI